MRNAIAGVVVAGLWFGFASSASAQVSITTLGSTYTQDFNGLASANTSSVMPTGWVFIESGTNANTTYAVGTGSGTSGDTYSFGAASASERALGGLRSNSLEPRFGASFVNNTGGPITSLAIAYRGEQWRLGATGRVDRLDFQISTDATSVTTGDWTDVDTLDFESPVTTGVGAKDGNLAANQKSMSATVPVSLASGATIWIRWLDFNASGADDGLAVDDFTLTAAGGVVVSAPIVAFMKGVSSRAEGPVGPTSILDYHVSLRVESTSTQAIATTLLTDTLPLGVTPLGTTFSVQVVGSAAQDITSVADGDAGSLVGRDLMLDLGAVAKDVLVIITIPVTVDARDSAGTLSNVAHLAYTGAVDGVVYTADSPSANLDVVACVDVASGSIPLCEGDITFVFFFDTNGNGVRDAGEPGIADWDVQLEDGHVNTTDSDGSVTFAGLPAGVDLAVLDDPPDAAATWNYALTDIVRAVPSVTTTIIIAVSCDCPDDGDGDACTSLSCFLGACSTTVVDTNCDDHNPCTDDTCASNSGCGHTPNTLQCDDGDLATRLDVCADSLCAGTSYTCTLGLCEASSLPDGDGCTITYSDVTAGCDDSHADTKDDRCDGSGGCSGTTYTCTPGACELTSVPNGVGCTTTPRLATDVCNDGKVDTKDDHCDGFGACTGTGYTCTPSKACVTSAPDGATCVETAVDDGTLCNDQSASTRDDVCTGGTCAGTAFTCTPSQCEATSVPNGATCTVTNKLATATCDDGLASTQNDHCDGSGGCVGTAYTCTPTQCEATSVPNGVGCTVTNKLSSASCDDGNLTTQSDHCNGNGGCVGTAYTCTPNACQLTSVANGVDCTTTNKLVTATCDDGTANTKDDHCDGSGQCIGTTYACAPSQCEASAAPNGTDCTVVNKDTSATCDDGFASTRDDHCNGAGACRGMSFTCTAGPCETSSTPNGTDCTRVLKAPSTDCDDGDLCTNDDKCSEVGVCVGVVAACDPGEICSSDLGCASTHCVECESNDECGASSACLSTAAGDRCLLGCTTRDDCGPGQLCREHETGGMRCFDTGGACVAPAENADISPEEPPEVGPEPVEDIVETAADTTGGTDTSGPDASDTGTKAEADISIVSGGSDGCAGAGGASLPMLLGLLTLAFFALRRRRA